MGFNPQHKQRIFPLASVSWLAPRPNHSPIQWVLGILSLGVKHSWCMTLTTHSHLVLRSKMRELYLLSPLMPAWYSMIVLLYFTFFKILLATFIHPSNGATVQIGPWPPLLRFHNNNVLWCEVVSLTTNPLTLRDLWFSVGVYSPSQRFQF
jgi:hypothetical protein